jgi:hypothetical protein
MNIHVPLDIQERFKSLEFRGTPFMIKNKKFIKAWHKCLNVNLYYCFEDDFAWFYETWPDKILPR